MNETILKPCPFCGSEAFDLVRDAPGPQRGVGCCHQWCCLGGRSPVTVFSVIEWNTRINESSETLKAEWVPCEERLPEKGGHYLVTYRVGNYPVGVEWRFANGFIQDSNILAWMPLPKPYAPQEEK